MSKILITGSSGFIGSFLVEEGIRQQHEIYAAVRASSRLSYLKDSRIHILLLNLEDLKQLTQQLENVKKHVGHFDFVIHNAGITQAKEVRDFDKVNYKCTSNLIQALNNTNLQPQKFILMSSLAAHGPGDPISLRPIEITDTPKPITYYGKSKLKAEQHLKSQQKIPFLIFRPTAVYGPREKDFLSFFKIVGKHIEPYISSPGQLLSFIYVKDLVWLIYASLESPLVNKSYFVSDGKNYTCSQFASIVKVKLHTWTIRLFFPKRAVKLIAFVSEKAAKLFHTTSVLNLDKYKELTSLNWACESSKTWSDFNCTPQYDLEKGVEETIKWNKTNKYL